MIAAEGSVPHFQRGAVVVLSLQSPREKLFGAVIALVPFGLVFSGIQLESLDDLMIQLREGDAVRPGTFFIPMHRIERVELDRRSGEVPSLAERFESKTGLSARNVFSEEGTA